MFLIRGAGLLLFFIYIYIYIYMKKCNGIRYTFSMNNANTGVSIS